MWIFWVKYRVTNESSMNLSSFGSFDVASFSLNSLLDLKLHLWELQRIFILNTMKIDLPPSKIKRIKYRKVDRDTFLCSSCQMLLCILLDTRAKAWQLCAAMMSWVGYLLTNSELFILFAENSQILLKISVIPILSTFIYLAALLKSVSN